MSKVLKLSFNLSSGKRKAWNIPDPKQNVTRAEVTTIANNIINEEFFAPNNDDVISLHDIYIYESNKIEVN